MKMTKIFAVAIAAIMMTAQVAEAKGSRSGSRSKVMSRSHNAHNSDHAIKSHSTIKSSKSINSKKLKNAQTPQKITHAQPVAPNHNPDRGLMVPLTVAGALAALSGNSSVNTTETVVYREKCANKEKAKTLSECQKPKQ